MQFQINWSSIIGLALWALLPGFIARKKGRSFWGYFFLSFLISPLITTIITACESNLNKQSDELTEEQTEDESHPGDEQ